MSLQLKVGKKYLDENGDRWTVTEYCQFFPQLFKGVKDRHPSMGPERFTIDGIAVSAGIPNLVSEVNPTAQPASPVSNHQFKVGDRVRVRGTIDDGVISAVQGSYYLIDFDNGKSLAFEVEYLLPIFVPPVSASAPTCTCPTFALMRDGCTCGHARAEIEKEFKAKGWK